MFAKPRATFKYSNRNVSVSASRPRVNCPDLTNHSAAVASYTLCFRLPCSSGVLPFRLPLPLQIQRFPAMSHCDSPDTVVHCPRSSTRSAQGRARAAERWSRCSVSGAFPSFRGARWLCRRSRDNEGQLCGNYRVKNSPSDDIQPRSSRTLFRPAMLCRAGFVSETDTLW